MLSTESQTQLRARFIIEDSTIHRINKQHGGLVDTDGEPMAAKGELRAGTLQGRVRAGSGREGAMAKDIEMEAASVYERERMETTSSGVVLVKVPVSS